jgi:hypothetical protein
MWSIVAFWAAATNLVHSIHIQTPSFCGKRVQTKLQCSCPPGHTQLKTRCARSSSRGHHKRGCRATPANNQGEFSPFGLTSTFRLGGLAPADYTPYGQRIRSV